jgi:hypothetical protein
VVRAPALDPEGEHVHRRARDACLRPLAPRHRDQQDKDNKGRYKFPYGDFENIHRCALLAAESRAGQRTYTDIQLAAAHLHGMVEEIRQTQGGRSTGRP